MSLPVRIRPAIDAVDPPAALGGARLSSPISESATDVLREKYTTAYFEMCADVDAGIPEMRKVRSLAPKNSIVRKLAEDALQRVDAGF